MQQMKCLLKKIQNVVRRVSVMFEPRPRRTETPDQCSQEHTAPFPHSSQSEGYHLGKPGCQLFSSCPQPPVADAKFWVMLLKGKVLPSGRMDTLPWASAAKSPGAVITFAQVHKVVIPPWERQAGKD